jgi:hypothetical protein
MEDPLERKPGPGRGYSAIRERKDIGLLLSITVPFPLHSVAGGWHAHWRPRCEDSLTSLLLTKYRKLYQLKLLSIKLLITKLSGPSSTRWEVKKSLRPMLTPELKPPPSSTFSLGYFIFNYALQPFKAYCAIWVRRTKFRHQASHHTRAPSGGRWNYGREMSGNFA